MQAQLILGSAVFAQLAGEWDDLAGRGMTDTPFQSLAYQRAWWQNLQPDGSELCSVATRDEEGALTGIAVFYVTADGVIHFNGCVEETDYLDLIAEARHASAVWTAVFSCLMNEGYPPWRLLELCNVPAASPTRTILPALAESRGQAIVESVDEVCPVISLPQGFETYIESLDAKQRRELRRKLRRAAGAGAELERVGPDDDLPQAVDDFLGLLQNSTLDKKEWLNPARRAVFHEVALAAQAAGTLQLLFVSIYGRRAAGLFNFDYRDRIWVYNSGLEPSMYGSLSLGVVLTAWAIEQAIAAGRREFDFLRGSESYKYQFGAADTTVHRLQLVRAPRT